MEIQPGFFMAYALLALVSTGFLSYFEGMFHNEEIKYNRFAWTTVRIIIALSAPLSMFFLFVLWNKTIGVQ